MTRKRVHWIIRANVGPTEVTTHCGLKGRRTITDGADDTYASRFQIFRASKRLSEVTCRRCDGSKRKEAAPVKKRVGRVPRHEKRSWSVKH